MNGQSISQRLAGNRYILDDEESHIVVNQEVAAKTGAAAILIQVCPAHVYSETADGEISVEYAACLECGTCLAVAPPGALEWRYPRGGVGIQYRLG